MTNSKLYANERRHNFETKHSGNRPMNKKWPKLLREIVTAEARARLTNVRMVKHQFAEQIEMQLIQLSSSGKLRDRVTDEQLKTLLQQLQGKERERKISFR